MVSAYSQNGSTHNLKKTDHKKTKNCTQKIMNKHKKLTTKKKQENKLKKSWTNTKNRPQKKQETQIGMQQKWLIFEKKNNFSVKKTHY